MKTLNQTAQKLTSSNYLLLTSVGTTRGQMIITVVVVLVVVGFVDVVPVVTFSDMLIF